MLRRTAFVLGILATWPASAAADAVADSYIAGNLDRGGDALSVLAFAILFVGLVRLVAPEHREGSRR